jgi:hypothetical protein
MDMSEEWQTAYGPNKCQSGCHQEGGRQGVQELDGQKESRIQWQREDWKKDSGWIEKNGGWESEDISDIKKLIHTKIRMNTCK